MEREAQPSDIVFLPYLVGERAPLWDGDRAGALLGLRPAHGPDAVLQATIEGVLFALRSVLTALEAVDGLPDFGPICASGPLGADRAMGQVRADIYGREIVRYDSAEDATSLAAMLIATCAVTGEDPYELMMRRRSAVWSAPRRPDVTERYQRAYHRYQCASEALAGFDAAYEEQGG
jgi:gluconokinase